MLSAQAGLGRFIGKDQKRIGMDDADIIEGTDMYEECKKKGGCYGDLINSLPSYYNSYVY